MLSNITFIKSFKSYYPIMLHTYLIEVMNVFVFSRVSTVVNVFSGVSEPLVGVVIVSSSALLLNIDKSIRF